MGPEFSFVLGLTSLLIPVAFLFALAHSRGQTRISRSIRLAAGAPVTLLFFLAAPWSFLSYYLRFIFLAIFFGASSQIQQASSSSKPIAYSVTVDYDCGIAAAFCNCLRPELPCQDKEAYVAVRRDDARALQLKRKISTSAFCLMYPQIWTRSSAASGART
jgi:hypothetical protein